MISRFHPAHLSLLAGISVLLASTACIPPTTPGEDEDTGTPDTETTSDTGTSPDTSGTEIRTLASCSYGTFDLSAESTTHMEDVFTSLPHSMSLAQMFPGDDQNVVDLVVGLSKNTHLSEAAAATNLWLNVPLVIDGTSGTIDLGEQASDTAVLAVDKDGEYIGGGLGQWGHTSITGDWNLEAFQEGKHITGTLEINLESLCATADSQAVYSLSFDIPLVNLGLDELDACMSFEGSDPNEAQVGRLKQLEVGGEPWEVGPSGTALYSIADDTLGIVADKEGRNLTISVSKAGFGDNEPDKAFYTDADDCGYAKEAGGTATVTVPENESGDIAVGPTSGSFDLSLQKVPGAGSSCADTIDISADFDLAVCRQRR